MADIRPFRGLRYNPTKEPHLGAVMCPPYDIISAEDEAALVSKNTHNIVRVELAITNDESSYARAGEALRAWRKEGVLRQEASPALYLARHEFVVEGKRMSRTEVTAAVRLEEPAKGVVLPHEATRARAKDDRLQLLRATRTNTSPVMLLHDGGKLLEPSEPPLTADMGGGEKFTFWAVTEPARVRGFTESLADKPLYIADGHHRYETALNYRNENKAGRDDAASFVMAALISFSDPGLLVQGYHRLFKAVDGPSMAKLKERISRTCAAETRDAGGASPAAIAAMVTEAFRGKALFAAWGLEPGKLSLLSLKDDAVLDEIVAKGHSKAWAGLSNCVFREAILLPALGIHEEEAESRGLLAFSKDIAEAVQAVNAGAARMAFLCKPIAFDPFKEVSQRGERLPPKSTFFYPKLPTGLVMKPAEGKL